MQVDIYGKCGNLTCQHGNASCLEMLEADYKFYLAFENSNSKDYITEKFFVNSLQNNVIPIVMGAMPKDLLPSIQSKDYRNEVKGYLFVTFI